MYKGIYFYGGTVFDLFWTIPLTDAHIVVPNPNASKCTCTGKLDKKILLSKMVHKDVQDYNDRSGLQFIKFDFFRSC